MEISDLVRSLLLSRGVESGADVEAFLHPDYETQLHAPELLSGMKPALERFFHALEKNERIAIYADYDCDGVSGAAIFSDFFKKIGYDNVEIYLPHRDREGYGFHASAVETLALRGVQLIITVDVGTTAVEAVQRAREKNIDVIVTDHHEIMRTAPDALAVVNPKLAPYPFPHLCGAAVAFKFVCAALREGKRRALPAFLAIPDGWEKWLLDLVALATIADMVPLTGENRILAHWGLLVLRKSPRPGIAALCTSARLRRAELTEDDIGFSICPRLNAASRMDEPDLALRILITRDRDEADQLAAKLERLNARRKGIVAGIVRQAKKRAKDRFPKEERVVVLGDPEWKPALLGLAANSVMAERGGVVCLWGRDGQGRIKGSCRSDGALSLVDLFGGAPGAFEEYGGHAHSGGFSVANESVHTLQETLASAALALERESIAKVSHDAHLMLSEISPALFSDISRLAPYGIGNPKPVFRISGIVVTEVRRFGKEKNHIECMLECRRSGARARAFDFFRSPEDFSLAPAAGTSATVLATLEHDSFRGGLALRLVDVVAAS